MRILLYSHAFWPEVGGVETVTLLLAQGMNAAGHSVTVITDAPGDAGGDSVQQFRILRRPGLRTLLGEMRRADVIHMAGPSLAPLIAGLFVRKPIVVEFHGYQSICPQGQLLYGDRPCPGHFQRWRLWKCLQCQAGEKGVAQALKLLLLQTPRLILSRVVPARFIAITDHVAARHGFPRTTTIYYGIAEAPRAAERVLSEPIEFAYVGRLVREKGLPLLLAAAKRLRDMGYSFRLRLIGDGPQRASLEALAGRLELQQIFGITGFLRGQELLDATAGVTAMVMPSIWEETAGLSAIEQMMRGGVVIAANIGGLAEIVGSGGILFQPNDESSLASAMQRVLDNPAIVSDYAARARERATANFTVNKMTREHLELYDSLLQHSRS